MNTEDKRRHERFKSLNLSYVCLDEKNNVVKQGMGRTLNLSESGILLETYFPIESNHTVQLTIGLEEDLIDIAGKLIHTRSKAKNTYEVGIQFVEMDQATGRILHRFLENLDPSGSDTDTGTG